MGTHITSPLDRIHDRAIKLNSLAVDACRSERWHAHAWLIREYRRLRIRWHTAAEKLRIPGSQRCTEWGVHQTEYTRYLEICRQTF